MSEEKKPSYEEHFRILEEVTESLSRDEIQVDDLMNRTREALSAARVCLEILQKQKGEFTTLQQEFDQLVGSLEGGGARPVGPGPAERALGEEELPF